MHQRVNADRHKPNRFRSYKEIHLTVIQQYKTSGFIGSDSLTFRNVENINEFGDKGIRLKGRISCKGQILIDVDKMLRVIEHNHNDQIVQTIWYAYNVSVSGHGNIFRYDNQDREFSFRSGHQDEHHKHVYAWGTNQEFSYSPIWIGKEKWPLLGEVIEEARKWYWKNRSQLLYPDS